MSSVFRALNSLIPLPSPFSRISAQSKIPYNIPTLTAILPLFFWGALFEDNDVHLTSRFDDVSWGYVILLFLEGYPKHTPGSK